MSEIEAASAYDEWFTHNRPLFESELEAIASIMPDEWTDAVEVGCGTGLFAEQLGVGRGVEPSASMADRARDRGLTVESGRAEALPLERDAVDLALALGVLGYVDEFDRALGELARVVEPGGQVVVAFLAAGRAFAELYDEAAAAGAYPSDLEWETPYPLEMVEAAEWRSVEEVLGGLRSVGFAEPQTAQTLTEPPETAVRTVESPTDGHDRGSWIVVRATRSETATD
jgi:SAM-dependent methyltransferase